MATGTVVTTETYHSSMRKIIWDWTCTAGGLAGDTTDLYYDGKAVGLTTIPDAVLAPDDNYGVEILDSDDHDVLLGAGLLRDTANTEHVVEAAMAGVSMSQLTLSVTAAGNAEAGQVILWIR